MIKDAVVLQHNSILYPKGAVKVIASGDGIWDLSAGEYWARPVKDSGIARGYDYVKAAAAPTVDSVKVTKVVSGIDTFWVVGTVANLLAAHESGTAMPAASTIPVVIPERTLVDEDGDGDVECEWVAPADAGNYYANVLVDGAQAVAPAAVADIAALVAWLNTNYAAAGTWSNPAGRRIKLVKTAAKLTVGLEITTGA